MKYYFLFIFFLILPFSMYSITRVFVKNNTPYTFYFKTDQVGAILNPDTWKQTARKVLPYKGMQLLQLNRAIGIPYKKTCVFTTRVMLHKNTPQKILEFKQKISGQCVTSQLWQAINDSGWYQGVLKRPIKQLCQINKELAVEVQCNQVSRIGNNDILYVINPDSVEHKLLPSSYKDNQLNVFFLNVFMRPRILFFDGQNKRAQLIPSTLKKYDIVAFAEAFDDTARATLLHGMRRHGFVYQSQTVKGRGVYTGSGLVIVSKYPIINQELKTYTISCGADHFAKKGAVYVRIQKGKQVYHIFATHLQAHPYSKAIAVRYAQIRALKKFIDQQKISKKEPVIIVGDFNVDASPMTQEKKDIIGRDYFKVLKQLFKHTTEYEYMLHQLNVTVLPQKNGYPYSIDTSTNDLCSSHLPFETLDFVLYSNEHRKPINGYQQICKYRASWPYKKTIISDYYYDLSDHNGVFGWLEF